MVVGGGGRGPTKLDGSWAPPIYSQVVYTVLGKKSWNRREAEEKFLTLPKFDPHDGMARGKISPDRSC